MHPTHVNLIGAKDGNVAVLHLIVAAVAGLVMQDTYAIIMGIVNLHPHQQHVQEIVGGKCVVTIVVVAHVVGAQLTPYAQQIKLPV
jgi:hypothetical protein